MNQIILATATRYLMPLLLLLSLFVLLRGHSEPGGGFIGGLIAAAAFSLYAIAYNVQRARYILRAEPRTVIAGGLLISLGSAIFPMFFGEPFLKALWIELPIISKIGTPLFFDIGVYLVVLGVTLKIIFTLSDEVDPHPRTAQSDEGQD